MPWDARNTRARGNAIKRAADHVWGNWLQTGAVAVLMRRQSQNPHLHTFYIAAQHRQGGAAGSALLQLEEGLAFRRLKVQNSEPTVQVSGLLECAAPSKQSAS